MCRFCGTGGKESDVILEVHHIIWKFYGGTDDLSNLIVTCVVCHDKIHYGKYSGRPRTFTALRLKQSREKGEGVT